MANSRFRSAAASVALLLLLAAGSAFAATTGTLFGTVTDADGSALPGVNVTISSPSLQGTRTVTTNASGEYKFPLLPPGTYRADYEIASFEKVVRTDVVVSLDNATKINVTLALARVSESVEVVSDTVVIDPTKTNTQLNLKEDHLKYSTIGLANRSYQTVVLEAPGAGSQAGSGGNPSFFGSNFGQNSFLIDGLNTTDPVTHTFTSNFTFDSIQEIAVQTSGFEAEYGKAIGGIINVITKSGGNDFHGTLDVRYQSEQLTENGERKRDFPAGTDTLRYDRDSEDFKNLAPAATLGGPILRDRVWFFGSLERPDFTRQRPDLFGFQPGRREFKGWSVFGKVTATTAPNQTLALKFNSETADIDHAEDSSFYTEAAGYKQTQDLTVFNASYDAVFSTNWLMNLQAGYIDNKLDAFPQTGDLDTTGVIDQVTGISSVNYTNLQNAKRPRFQALGSTSYLADFLGSHLFKVGTDLEWTRFESVNNVTGTPFNPAFCSPEFGQPAGATCGAIDEPADGDPFLYLVYTDVPEQIFKAHGMAFYVQDEWRPVPSVTAKLGARYDEVDYLLEDDEKVKTFSRIQPRVGVSWDVFNNSSTIFKVNAGEFMEDSALTLPGFLARQGTVLGAFLFTGQEFEFLGAFGGPSGNTLDPSLRPTYSQQISTGITQRIFKNTSLDVTGIYRRNRRMFEDTCFDADCNTYWLTNRPAGQDVLKSEYRGVIFKVESRPTNAMSWIFSYTLSKSRSSVEYTQNTGTDFDFFPDHFVNRYGFTSDDARHVVKLDGYVRLPWNLFAGTSVYWDSGVAYNVTRPAPAAPYGLEFLEPRGSRRLPDFYRWDAQLQKDFVVGPVRLGLIGSVFNILDTEIEIQRDGNVGDGGTVSDPTNERFNFATSWQRPRSYELGFRVEF